MLKAGALFYAITVALIIGLISASLVAYAWLNRLEIQQSTALLQLQRNAASGINLLVAKPDVVGNSSATAIDLFGAESDSVLLERKQWGGFEIDVATGFSGKHRFTRAAMVGANLHSDSKVALYLADRNKPLSLCGRTVVNGTCYLPKAGVKRAYIEGQTFVGAQLVTGEVRDATRNLPEINTEMVRTNMDYLDGLYQPYDSVIKVGMLPDTLVHSFTFKTLLLEVEGDLPIVSGMMHGNVRIVSSGRVFIGADANLDGVVIHARELVVEDGFQGSLQAFVSDSVAIGKGANLNYPSVIGLVRRPDKEFAQLNIMEKANINGVVFAWQEQSGIRNKLKLGLQQNAIVHGQVYTNGMVDLKGSIYGSLACNGFLLNTPSSVYENHLLNATIDYDRLSNHFVGINLVYESPNRKIVSWLY